MNHPYISPVDRALFIKEQFSFGARDLNADDVRRAVIEAHEWLNGERARLDFIPSRDWTLKELT